LLRLGAGKLPQRHEVGAVRKGADDLDGQAELIADVVEDAWVRAHPAGNVYFFHPGVVEIEGEVPDGPLDLAHQAFQGRPDHLEDALLPDGELLVLGLGSRLGMDGPEEHVLGGVQLLFQTLLDGLDAVQVRGGGFRQGQLEPVLLDLLLQGWSWCVRLDAARQHEAVPEKMSMQDQFRPMGLETAAPTANAPRAAASGRRGTMEIPSAQNPPGRKASQASTSWRGAMKASPISSGPGLFDLPIRNRIWSPCR
jgi:hypothetical protein